MAFIVRMAEEGERELFPEGDWEALVYQLVEGGIQPNPFGEDKRRLFVGWEVPKLRIEIDGKDLPRAYWKTYNLPHEGRGLHVKSHLRIMLTQWRGRAFTPEEMKAFDLKIILGKSCIIRIEHETNYDTGKQYADLKKVMKWPKDKPMLEPENELLYFSFQEDMDIPDNLPDWMIKTIKSSYEWQHRQKELPPPDTSGLPLEEGDIPF